MASTLWKVAREFSPSGYGLLLREKLTEKWCECGCSTDHLGEVCERTVREGEASECGSGSGSGSGGMSEAEMGKGKGKGKKREWDGRGNGVLGWETREEEDVWDLDLDFGGEPDSKSASGEDGEGREGPNLLEDTEASMTIAEAMEWRFLKAEREKELVS